MEIENLKREIDLLRADLISQRTAWMIITTALLKTTSDRAATHLYMTSLLEQQLGETGTLGKRLSDQQRLAVREIVEWYGAL